MSSKKPNIIYFYSDQHRHDAMGCAGNSVIKTPNLDRMANEGMRFSRAYSQCPVCQPARASVLTGLYNHQHNISQNFVKDFDPGWSTMPKQLQSAGYTTAKIGKTHFYTPRRETMKDKSTPEGFDLRKYNSFVRSFGFDYVLEEFDRYMHAYPKFNLITPYTEHLKAKGLLEPYQEQIRSIWRLTPTHWNGVTSVLPQEDDLTSFIADQAIEWLSSYDDDKPFFLMVSFVAPHVPLMADPLWAEYYQNAEIARGPRESPEKTNEIMNQYLDVLFNHSNSPLLTDEYVLNGARQYYGMVSLIDQQIGNIIRVVEERGLGDNTWFFYSSDHGEMLGDHNLMAKMNFYKSSVLVPAIIRPPERMTPKVVDGIIESIDLTRTILDVAGADPTEGSQARSLLPFINGGGKVREAAFSAIEFQQFNAYLVMAATERYRLTIERGTGAPCELFDLKEDPDELNNLVNDQTYKGIRDDIIKDYINPHLRPLQNQ
ncbi:MAG: sulfatase-like hydrolase/transferase [Deltaproteobacteria bacterium]|nr:sulfatase-like hydrolase/transferase [Deltaproteobacteria bacterium]MBW2053284.1 sulfatase-like hydrolase/transferase [Deltaproteobacteria bacterium]